VINVAQMLETAQRLLDAGQHQTDLRRSISTTYYALFYALGQECARLVFGNSTASLRRRQVLMRALGHEEMRKACRSFIASKLPELLMAARVGAAPLDPGVVRLAKAFFELYGARIGADYDHVKTVLRPDAEAWLDEAREVINLLPSLRRVPDFQVFLMALMHQSRLSGREQ
jgi:hypothetical protein